MMVGRASVTPRGPRISTRRIVAEWLRDSAIGFLLFVGGMSLVDILRLLFGWESRLLSLPCMYVGFFPFLWFAKRKGAIAFDNLDVFAWIIFGILSAWVLSYSSVLDWLGEHTYYGDLVFPISVLAPIFLYRGIRGFYASRFNREGKAGNKV